MKMSSTAVEVGNNITEARLVARTSKGPPTPSHGDASPLIQLGVALTSKSGLDGTKNKHQI